MKYIKCRIMMFLFIMYYSNAYAYSSAYCVDLLHREKKSRLFVCIADEKALLYRWIQQNKLKTLLPNSSKCEPFDYDSKALRCGFY